MQLKKSRVMRLLTMQEILPIHPAHTAHQHLLTARALHESKRVRGEEVFEILDWSSLVAGTRVASGLDGFDSSQVRVALIVPIIS